VRIGGANAIASQEMITREDAYYFAHHDDVELPVYRIILDNADATRFYLDPATGALRKRADADARWQRWLLGGGPPPGFRRRAARPAALGHRHDRSVAGRHWRQRDRRLSRNSPNPRRRRSSGTPRGTHANAVRRTENGREPSRILNWLQPLKP
jgi:hypothetical protein